MRLSKPTRFNEILTKSGKGTKEALRRREEDDRLRLNLKKAVPSFLQEHCVACVEKKGNLIVFTDSSVWASQLRFHSNLIIKELKKLSLPFQIDTVTIRVLPFLAKPGDSKRYCKVPAPETITVLKNNAHTLPDSELKASLLRLADTLEKNKFAAIYCAGKYGRN